MENIKEKIIEAFNFRSAVKVFDHTRKVNDDDIFTILESARMSPTSYGLQPFRIIEVESDDKKNKIKEVAFNQKQITYCSNLYIITAINKIDEEFVNNYIENIAKTRNLNVDDLSDFKNYIKQDILNRDEKEKLDWAKRQSYIALGSMIMTSALLKVDTIPMEGFIPSKVDEILELNKLNLNSVCILGIGYRGDDEYSKRKKVRVDMNNFLIKI